MDPAVEAVQNTLVDAAKAILRFIGTHDLTQAECRQLSKFVYGCMNQRLTIAERVALRGSGELNKVLDFIGKAAETINEIDERLRTESESKSTEKEGE